MAAALDANGRYLLDADGALVGVAHSASVASRITQLCRGDVFQSGFGEGTIRQALLAAVPTTVTSVISQDPNLDAFNYYTEAYPGDGGSITQIATLTAMANQISPPAPPAVAPTAWTMAVFDFCAEDLSADATFVSNVHTLWPVAGGRLVVISERSDVTLAGFATNGPELIDGSYVYVFDRFDPGSAIGTANPHGTVYIPGYGWQP